MNARTAREQVVDLVDGLAAGRGNVLVLTGPAGIGKTSILQAAHRRVERLDPSIRRLEIRGHQPERDLQFAGLTSLLAQVRPDLDRDSVPRPQHDLLDAIRAGTTGEIGNELAVGAAVLTVLDVLQRRGPVLLTIDDAQWIDLPSLDAVMFAIRRAAQGSLGAVVASRQSDLLSFGTLLACEVEGLELAEAREILRSGGLIDEEVALQCWQVTEGNPLALNELSRRLQPEHRAGNMWVPWHEFVPRRLVDAFAEQIAALPPATQRALLALAIGGAGSLSRALEAVRATSADLDVAERERLVLLDGPIRFAHPIHAAAAVACAGAEEVRAVHRQLSQTLDDPDRASWHAAQGANGLDGDAAERLAATAHRARSRGVLTAAAAAFERAADLEPHPGRAAGHRLDAAHAWWYSTRGERSLELLEMMDVAELPDERRVLAELRSGLVHTWVRSAPGAATMLAQAADARCGTDPSGAITLWHAAAGAAALATEIDRAAHCARRAEETAAMLGDPILDISSQAVAGFARLVAGEAELDDPGVATLLSLNGVELAELPDEQLDLIQFIGFAFVILERFDEAVSVLEALRLEARRRGVVTVLNFATAMLGEAHRRRGAWAMAERWASETGWFRRDGGTTAAELGIAVTAWIRAHRGQPDAKDLANEVLAVTEPIELGFVSAYAFAALGAQAIVDGDPERAVVALDEIEGRVHRGGGREPGAVWYELDRIEALIAVGRLDDAARMSDRLCDHGTRTGRRWSRAVGSLGQLLIGAARGSDLDQHAAASVLGEFAALGAPFERARALLAVANLGLAAEGRDEAAVIFERLGAVPWLSRARPSLMAEGATTLTSSLVDQLSAAELRVAMAVAAGRSNAETASELFLSQRTVEAHLRAIFRKLGIRNRTELTLRVVADGDHPGRSNWPANRTPARTVSE